MSRSCGGRPARAGPRGGLTYNCPCRDLSRRGPTHLRRLLLVLLVVLHRLRLRLLAPVAPQGWVAGRACLGRKGLGTCSMGEGELHGVCVCVPPRGGAVWGGTLRRGERPGRGRAARGRMASGGLGARQRARCRAVLQEVDDLTNVCDELLRRVVHRPEADLARAAVGGGLPRAKGARRGARVGRVARAPQGAVCTRCVRMAWR